LTKHSFLLDIEEKALIANHFDRLVELVRHPVFFRLDYPREYGLLGEVRRAIFAHLELAV
jgi:chromosome condensin MukBEF MukE localization factor